MAKLFIGLALALMLATAALGFLAKGNIDKLQSSVKSTKQDLQLEQGKARTAETEQKKAVGERDAAVAKADAAAKDLEAKTSEAKDAADKLADAKTQLDLKIKELEVAKAAPKPTIDTPVVEDPRVAALTAEVQKAQAELAEAKVALDQMQAHGKEAEVKLADLEQKEKIRQGQLGRTKIQGKILAVNNGWNFVVLSVGDKQGVSVSAPLLVVRGNEPVARLRITSVEPSTSIADVIPGSVRKGVTVQPGDTVIFEGRNSPTEAKPAAQATTAPLPH